MANAAFLTTWLTLTLYTYNLYDCIRNFTRFSNLGESHQKQLQDSWCSSLQNGWRRGNTLSSQKLSKEREIWAMSWDYFSSSVNSFSDTHAQPSNGASCLNFGRTLRLLPYFMCATTAMALSRLCGCAGSPEHSLVAYVISTIISWAGSLHIKF